jgi:TolB-like protein
LIALSKVLELFCACSGLKEVARTSALQFRDSGTDVREIGSRLGVETVMEGSFRRSCKQLRLSVILINAADGFTTVVIGL